MELAGNEKRIQALFRELKSADEFVAPEFSRMWRRAQASGPRMLPGLKISFVAALALLVVTVSSFVLWPRTSKQQSYFPAASVSIELDPKPAPPSVTLVNGERGGPRAFYVKARRWDRKAVRRHQETLSSGTIREANLMTSWRSPTAQLMQSPADKMLTSLPPLDGSLIELKTFLPNTQQ